MTACSSPDGFAFFGFLDELKRSGARKDNLYLFTHLGTHPCLRACLWIVCGRPLDRAGAGEIDSLFKTGMTSAFLIGNISSQKSHERLLAQSGRIPRG